MNDNEREHILDLTAETLDQALEKKVRQLDGAQGSIPENLDLRQHALVMEIEAERQAEQKRLRHKRIMQTAAAVVLCVTVTFGATMGVSEGFRKRVFQVLNYEQEGAIALRTGEDALIGDWSDYWYPTYLPAEYQLTEADEMDHFLLFQDNKGGSLRLFEETSDITATFDSETTENSRIKIGAHDGYIFFGAEGDSVDVYWMTDTRTLFMSVKGIRSRDEINKILDGLAYRE